MRKYSVLLVLVLLISIISTGCAMLDDTISKIKGELVGQKFEISTYDHFSNKTMTLTGSKVTIGLLENSANFDTESEGFKSEVLEITVNGNQMFQVGNTVIFEEVGLDKVTDFEVPSNVNVSNGGGFVPVDRFLNNYSNMIGKSKTIIISSQMGMPLAVYQGDSVYVTIPEDLPKTTRLNIDGKSLYIHRANYVILDSKMLK